MQPSPESEDARLPLLVTRDPERAEHWAAVISEAGVDAHVEISDGQVVAPGSSPLVGVFGTRPLDFVHVVTVTPADREVAVAALVDGGWDGREGMHSRSAPDMRRLALAAGAFVALLLALVALRAGTG
jgi:hypothetical protein